MGVPNFRIFSSLRMRADLNNFWWTWEPTRRTFGKFGVFFWQKIPNSQPKFLFVNSDFFSAKKKRSPFFLKVRHVGSHVHQKLFKSARILSEEKIFGFLLGFACITGDATSAFCISRGDPRTRFELSRAIVWCRAHEAFSNRSPLNHSSRRRRRSRPGEQRSHHVHEQASERASSVEGGGATRRAFAARFYTRPRVRARCAIAAAPSRPPRGIVQTSARPLRLAAPRRVEDAAAGRRVVERRRGAARRVAAERAWNGNGTLFHRLPAVLS